MNKQKQFQDAARKLTYWDVAQAFYDMSKMLHGEYYCSATELFTAEGKKVPGFVYTGYAAGAGIRRILDALNIKYIIYIKGGSGIDEKSEIHIKDEKSQKRFLDILEKCGRFETNLHMELNPLIDNRKNPLFQQIR